MKNKKGFTLIELLAVIIILGILMIIAIPSVTQYINNSRKSAYVDTAKEIISGARNMVNKGDLEMFDTNTTYYIPIEAIGTENGQKSPYGDFEEAYVVVTYNGSNYTYYWLSVDETGQGVKNITRADKLDEDSIESDIKKSDIASQVTTVGVGNRTTIKILDDQNDYKSWKTDITLSNTSNNVSEEGEGGGTSTNPVSNKLCKRAQTSTLHTETCLRTNNYGCNANNKYAQGATITYGNTTTTNGTLNSGDAFDCDVNDDGVWDSAKERFYYVAPTSVISTNDAAVLIYYTNVIGGTTETSTQNYAYYSGGHQNWRGPVTAAEQLPTTTQWSNSGIIAPGTRQITNENGNTTTNNGNSTIESFTYTNKAARLLTAQEVNIACGITIADNSSDSLYDCIYLMEKVGQYTTESGTYGYWLETPRASTPDQVWHVSGNVSFIGCSSGDLVASSGGVRPVITVLTSNISY